jgi:hypothetical protein
MKVPACPVELQDAWSPIGYQVVEVGDKHPPPARPRPRKRPTAEQPNEPCSPLDCQAEEVGEETSPRRKRAPRSKRPAPTRWVAVAAISVFLATAALALWVSRTSAPAVTPVAPPTAAKDQDDGPLGVREDGQDKRAAEQELARETFGTAIEFVRNPREAARLAYAERKLAFLLHVSGNFEEARFT